MDLNVCLYCEKQLWNDNTAFCSNACKSNEASKHLIELSSKVVDQNNKLTNNSSKQPSPETPIWYQMLYGEGHSRFSLSSSTMSSDSSGSNTSSEAKNQPIYSMYSTKAPSSSSFLSDASVCSTSCSCSCEDSTANFCTLYRATNTTHNITS